MCVRAIDYLPPVEFEFPDFLAALLVSDAEIVPDDKHGYRDTVRGAFARWGIQDADDHIADLSLSAVTPVYRNLSYTALRSDTDEVFRFIWENLELLQIDPRFYIHVEHVRPSVRVGPDGVVVAETGRGVTPVSRARQRAISGDRPAGPGSRAVRRPGPGGGGTIVFDQFGRAKSTTARTSATSGRRDSGSATWSATACPATTAWASSTACRPGSASRSCAEPDADPGSVVT